MKKQFDVTNYVNGKVKDGCSFENFALAIKYIDSLITASGDIDDWIGDVDSEHKCVGDCIGKTDFIFVNDSLNIKITLVKIMG